MGGLGVKYDAENGCWLSSSGQRLVRNEFYPTAPSYIVINDDSWEATHLNIKYRLSWPEGIAPSLKRHIERALMEVMRKRAPSGLKDYESVLRSVVTSNPSAGLLHENDLLDQRRMRAIWDALKPTYRTYFRSLFGSIAEEVDPVRGGAISREMHSWKARRVLSNGKTVLEWNPTQGALTSSELEELRRYLEPQKNEDVLSHFARLFTRLTLTTLRRPSQILRIPANGLRRHTTHIGTTTQIKIPLSKSQAAQPARWEVIPNTLADDIEAYRGRPPVVGSLAAQDSLLPFVSEVDGILTASNTYGAIIKERIRSWVKHIGIISPRTGGILHISLRRIRHTGATHMAMQGYPIDLIADVLQHDKTESARYYIDAVGAEFLPAFEKADRNLGGRFSAMRDAWFKGKVVNQEEANDHLIMVPEVNSPAVVGSCGSESGCPVNPLFSCYSCQHFLAFRNADHAKVLDYFEGEYDRWRASEISNGKSKVIKDFDRAAAGVREVIAQIKRENGNAKS